jgi:hypothetical protein
MEALEKFLRKHSYKFSKGYPDMGNPKDVLLLESLLEKHDIKINLFKGQKQPVSKSTHITEVNEYDNVIKHKLGKLPKPRGDYKLGQDIQLSGADQKIFKELYPVDPPKKGEDVTSAGSKGSGNGEIALYWLLSKNHDVKDGRGGGAPDLIVNGKGVEVKAYDSKKITLGRFSSDSESVGLLNTLFGLNALVSVLDKSAVKQKEANSLNFTRGDIIKAFEHLRDFSASAELRGLATKYSLIKNIFDKVDSLISTLKLPAKFKTEDAAAAMIRRIIAKKIQEKPGENGYLANVDESGKIKYQLISTSKLNKVSSDIILTNSAINQGQIIINPDAIF